MTKFSAKPVSDVVAHEIGGAAVAQVNIDPGPYARLGWVIVLLGVVGFFAWASLAPLDKGVPLSGNVAVASNRKAVQHQVGGTVDAILVKDGDPVKAGQVLVRMNNIAASSAAGAARGQWRRARGQQHHPAAVVQRAPGVAAKRTGCVC